MSSKEKTQTLLFDSSGLIDFIKRTIGYRSMTVSYGIVNYNDLISSVVGCALGYDDLTFVAQHLKEAGVSIPDMETIIGRIMLHTTVLILPEVKKTLGDDSNVLVKTTPEAIVITITNYGDRWSLNSEAGSDD